MVIRCFVCSNSSIKKTTNSPSEKPPLSFFGFPTDPSTRLNWFDIFELDPYDNVKNLRICSEHFAEDELEVQSTGRKMLIRGAVPSRNLTQRKNRYKMLKMSRSKCQNSTSNSIRIDKSDNNIELDDCSEVITIVRSDNDDEIINQSNSDQGEEIEDERESDRDGRWTNQNDTIECDKESCRELHLEKDKQILILKERNRRLEKRIELLTNMLSNFQS